MRAMDFFASNVLALRLRKRWSQTELAEAAGVSLQTVCRMEQMARTPSLDIAWRITNALGGDLTSMCSEKYPIPDVSSSQIGKRRINYGQ